MTTPQHEMEQQCLPSGSNPSKHKHRARRNLPRRALPAAAHRNARLLQELETPEARGSRPRFEYGLNHGAACGSPTSGALQKQDKRENPSRLVYWLDRGQSVGDSAELSEF